MKIKGHPNESLSFLTSPKVRRLKRNWSADLFELYQFNFVILFENFSWG